MKQSSEEVKWIIKDLNGKVIGPYSKTAIFNLIDRGILNGEEAIAVYPSGNWELLASEVEFYDRIMDVLEGKNGLLIPSSHPQMEENTVIMQLPQKEILEDEPLSETKKNQKEKGLLEKRNDENALLNNFHPDKKYKVKINNSQFIIEESKFSLGNKTDKKSIEKNRVKKIEKIIFIFILVFIMVCYLTFFEDQSVSSKSKIHLLAPAKIASAISKEEYTKNINLVHGLLESDNSTDWYESQNILVKLAEGQPNNTELREMICFIYKELWPFAYQDSEDLRVLNSMTQDTRAINPSALHGQSCQMIQSLLTGKIEEAKSQIDHLLLEAPDSIFYGWIKSDILLMERDFINAQGFATSVVNIWPNFLRAQIILAQSYEGLGQIQKTVDIYRDIIKKNPKHKVAKLRLGIIEYENYRSTELAWTTLTSGLNGSELAPPFLEARAYKDLAEISLLKNQTASARNYIEKAFKLDPVESSIRNLYQRLGGNNKIEVKDGKTAELIAIGDQYARSGDCFAAQAQYKAAYDIDPNSGVAAVKAAKCLWKISQSIEAIDYLKKAIINSPKYYPAYTMLADYYSQRFDFIVANRILNQAKLHGEESYELIRGQAQIEYRKNNFKAAIILGLRAEKIYSTDIETYMLLAHSYMGVGQVREAFHAAVRALELDSVNIEAQIVYAEVLHSYQGAGSAIIYLENLIKQNQNILEYKLAIASIYKKEEKFPNALIIYQQVIQTYPKNKEGLLGLGDSYQGIGQMENALSAFLKAATVDPMDPEALFKAGLLYLETARLGPAIQQFERVLLVNKNYPRVRYFIGKAAFAQGDIQKSLEYAVMEKKQNPNLVESYVLLAEIYAATHKYSLCTAEYQQVIKLQPQGASIYVKIAKCYRLSGSFDVAASMIEIAIQKESGYPDIYKEKGAIFQALGENGVAYAAYEKYLALSPNALDKAEIELAMGTLQSKQ
jgi:tetratricopeptide (TPR) repeat protein